MKDTHGQLNIFAHQQSNTAGPLRGQGGTKYPGPGSFRGSVLLLQNAKNMKIIQYKLILQVTCVVLVLAFRPAEKISHQYANLSQQMF